MRHFDLQEGWNFVRKHPYADLTALLIFIVVSAGGVRWWSRPTVQLKADGVTRKVQPHVKTVGEVLAQEHIVLGPDDFCTPDPQMPLRRNTLIQVTRVTHRLENQVQKHPPKITQRVQLKSNLRPVLVERGYVQEDHERVRATFYDGVKISQKVLKRKVTRRPIFTLTLFRGKSGQPEKTYDLTRVPRLEMRATGYYVGEKYVPSDTTYLGYKLRRGLVAVDPKVIPLRSRLYVKGYGYAYAADTGSAIKGNRIDLAVKDRKEEQQFNRHKMPVYILEKAKGW